MDYIIYEDTPQYSHWYIAIRALFLLSIAAITIPALISGTKDTQLWAGIFLIMGLFMGIAIWARLPRKYLIFDNRLKIAMGGPFSTTVPFESIETAGEATDEDFRSSGGFTTGHSRKNAVLIIRRLESATIITPSNRALFLEHLNKALSEWKNKMEVSTEADRGG